MATDFEQLYQADIDPWGYRESWYEQRKYAITMASLPRSHYRLVWEPACSIGVLSRLLAARADRVLSSDGSPTAIAEARSGDVPPNVEWSVQLLPGDQADAEGSGRPEPGTADLVMLSEILYYLSESDRSELLRQAHSALTPGGDVVVVHWLHGSHDTYLTGEKANDWVRTQPGWNPLITHRDEEFVLDVLRRS